MGLLPRGSQGPLRAGKCLSPSTSPLPAAFPDTAAWMRDRFRFRVPASLRLKLLLYRRLIK